MTKIWNLLPEDGTPIKTAELTETLDITKRSLLNQIQAETSEGNIIISIPYKGYARLVPGINDQEADTYKRLLYSKAYSMLRRANQLDHISDNYIKGQTMLEF